MAAPFFAGRVKFSQGVEGCICINGGDKFPASYQKISSLLPKGNSILQEPAAILRKRKIKAIGKAKERVGSAVLV